MMWFFAILIVLALGGIAVLAAGKGAPLAEVYDDRPDAVVPAQGPLGADHLRRVRFSIAFRGYRMSEVDALLDRLASEREGRPGDGREDVPADRVSAEAVDGAADGAADGAERSRGDEGRGDRPIR